MNKIAELMDSIKLGEANSVNERTIRKEIGKEFPKLKKKRTVTSVNQSF